MTTASRLEELAGRCEAASGADRDLDALIACAVGVTSKHPKWVQRWQGALTPYPGKPGYVAHVSGVWWSSAKVTASLDAAMSLVPEGWRIYTGDFSIEGRFRWMLSGPRLTWITHEDGSKEGGDDWYQSGVAATPALALTAASLRSRASLLRTQGESNG